MLGIIKIIVLSSLLIYLNSTSFVLASSRTLVPENELKSLGFNKYESINPNLLIFPLKRIIEDVKLKFIVDKNNQAKYQYSLLDTRFNELVFIINFQKTGFLAETVDRYNTLAGVLISNHKDQSAEYKQKLSFYLKVLKYLQDRYNSESAYRLLIQQAIDTTGRLL